jgi:hypothetical protein
MVAAFVISLQPALYGFTTCTAKGLKFVNATLLAGMRLLGVED